MSEASHAPHEGDSPLIRGQAPFTAARAPGEIAARSQTNPPHDAPSASAPGQRAEIQGRAATGVDAGAGESREHASAGEARQGPDPHLHVDDLRWPYALGFGLQWAVLLGALSWALRLNWPVILFLAACALAWAGIGAFIVWMWRGLAG